MSNRTLTAFKIEKGIPLDGVRNGRAMRYPWREMQINDSVLIACPDERKMATQRNVIGSYTRFRPKTFVSRQVDGGIRVWRTA